MKRLNLFFLLFLIFILSCKKEKEEKLPLSVKQKIIEQAFNLTIDSYNKASTPKSSQNIPVQYNINDTIKSEINGKIILNGVITGNLNIDNNYNFTGADFTLTLWENYYDYTIVIDNNQYILSTPEFGIYCYGKFYLNNEYNYTNNSYIDLSGHLEIKGSFGSEDVYYDVRVIIDPNGKASSMTGTINDTEINITFNNE